MKRIIIISFIGLMVFLPNLTHAGLVPCGLSADDPDQPGDQTVPCTLCHFFGLINNIVQFIMIKLVPITAVLMLVIGGGMLFFAGANPNFLNTAKRLIKSVIIGLLVIYAAFLITGTVLNVFGLADWTKDIYKSWWEEGIYRIDCPTP